MEVSTPKDHTFILALFRQSKSSFLPEAVELWRRNTSPDFLQVSALVLERMN
jgi:hypothetical protein